MKLLYWLFDLLTPSVSSEWLRDNTRRECSVGVDQSRSTWPWKTGK